MAKTAQRRRVCAILDSRSSILSCFVVLAFITAPSIIVQLSTSDNMQQEQQPHNPYEQERREKLRKLRELGVDPFGHREEGIAPLASIKSSHKPEMGHDGGPVVKGAGRIMLKRDMGKLSFLTLRDDSGDLQVALDKKRLNETAWQINELLDLGDQIVVEGHLGTTKKGEITIWATSLAIASKALLPPPG